MGLTELIFGIEKASIGVVELDASVRELHQESAQVTRHPVEADAGSQSSVSDNVHVEPVSIQIEGVITNHPTDFLTALLVDDPERRVDENYFDLSYYLRNGELIDVVTTLRQYDNMVLESLQVTRDAAKGNALYLNATLTQVQLVDLQEASLDSAKRPVNASTGNGGKKPAAEADAATSSGSQSALSKLLF